MAAKLSYLKRSQNGFYKYRRRVPSRLRQFFPRTVTGGLMDEWQTAFRTKDPATAHSMWLQENAKFEEAQRNAEIALSGANTPGEFFPAAKIFLKNHRLYPGAMPKPPRLLNHKSWGDYSDSFGRWEEQRKILEDALIDQLDDATLDREQQEKDYKEGRWGEPGYKTPRKVGADTRVLEAAYDIVTGDPEPNLQPSWSDAVENYIAIGKQEKASLAGKLLKWEKDTRRVTARFGAAIGGMNKPLNSLERTMVRRWIFSTYPKAGTRNRYVNTLNAVINAWNRETTEKVFNPFSGLTSKVREQEEATDRRSFTPAQLSDYIKHLTHYANQEARLIGLIMVYTGCRTDEAAGLQVKDVVLNAEVPFIRFRTNPIRRIDKKGLERACPVVPELRRELERFSSPTSPEAAYFQRYGRSGGAASVSTLLSRKIRRDMGINDPRVVPYSTRHTLHDRMDVARVSERIQQYITGHKTAASSEIHNRYGTKMPPSELYEDLVRTFRTADWGDFTD